MDREFLINEIKRLKQQRKAVIVAHSYQNEEIQDLADVVGDSYALSKYCATQNDAEVIVFCGVHFMAESAKILSPAKTVLLPELNAGCPMADMVDKEGLAELKEKHPEATVLCYINTTAEVKALCDVCCTSSNAVNIVQKIKSKEIIFVPDKNLSRNIAIKVPDSKIILWEGYCPVHNGITCEMVIRARDEHPDAILLMHPECPPEVCELAEFVGSTKQIIEYATASSKKEFIIGTEKGMMYPLQKKNPYKKFYLLDNTLVCETMKITSIESVYKALTENVNEIKLSAEIIEKAKGSLEKMLELAGE